MLKVQPHDMSETKVKKIRRYFCDIFPMIQESKFVVEYWLRVKYSIKNELSIYYLQKFNYQQHYLSRLL